jgi:hypothetical protein
LCKNPTHVWKHIQKWLGTDHWPSCNYMFFYQKEPA